MRLRWAFVLMVALGVGEEAWPQEPAASLPMEARAVLARFVGLWTTEVESVHHDPPRRFSTVGKAEGRWTLEGRFVEFRSHSIPPGESDLQIMTYVPETARFQQWVFDSSGYVHTASGTWRPESSTLVWEGDVRGTRVVIHDQFVSADRLEWTMHRTDAGGRVLQTIRGTVTRRHP